MRNRPVEILSRCPALLALAFGMLSGCDEHQLPERISEPRPHVYLYGDRVGFGYGGDAARFRRDGWAKPEEDFTWTKGLGATLHFRVFSSDQPLTLRMKASGVHKSPQLPFQPVEVSVNGRKLATWRVRQTKYHTAVIPREMVDLGPDAGSHTASLVIDLYTPKAIAPSDLDVGRDTRRLGICVREMFIIQGAEPQQQEEEVLTAPETPEGSSYTYGQPVFFGTDGSGERYKLGGFHDAEPEFTWTGKVPAALGFRVPPATKPLLLRFRLAALVKGPRLPVQPTELRVNGRVVTEWRVGEELAWFTATLPPEVANESGLLKIELVSRKAMSPNALGVNDDLRPLGVQLHEVNISEVD